jgi:hypothetical protein
MRPAGMKRRVQLTAERAAWLSVCLSIVTLSKRRRGEARQVRGP